MINLPLNMDYTGKVVVITGAGGVICGTMARAFAQAGAKVEALDLNEEAVKKLADELKAEGFICEGYQANVLDLEALKQVHTAVKADLGPCDILINGAGGNNPKAATDNEYQHLLFNEDGTPTARSEKILNGTPTHRFVDSEELLGATFFLCDDKSASAITGVILPVDAGFAAYSGV